MGQPHGEEHSHGSKATRRLHQHHSPTSSSTPSSSTKSNIGRPLPQLDGDDLSTKPDDAHGLHALLQLFRLALVEHELQQGRREKHARDGVLSEVLEQSLACPMSTQQGHTTTQIETKGERHNREETKKRQRREEEETKGQVAAEEQVRMMVMAWSWSWMQCRNW